jgi:hypothetical protein
LSAGTVHGVRARLVEIVGEVDEALPVEGHVSFGPRAKKVLELLFGEALSFGTGWAQVHAVGDCARARERRDADSRRTAGVSLDQIRTEVMGLAAGYYSRDGCVWV